MNNIRLEDIAVGSKAIVEGFSPGNGAYRGKLLSMGLTPGVQIQLAAVAPLGDPIEIKVRGFYLTLRKSEAKILKLRKPE